MKRKGIFMSCWPLRGTDREGHTRFLCRFDTVADKAMERAEQAAESKRVGTDVSSHC